MNTERKDGAVHSLLNSAWDRAARGGALPGGHDTDLRELGGGCEFIA